MTARPLSFAVARMRSSHSVFMLMCLAFGEMPCEVMESTSLRSAARRMQSQISSMAVWYAYPTMMVSMRKRFLSSAAGKNTASLVTSGLRSACFLPSGS